MKIWTTAYRPFSMGGNVRGNIATEVEIDKSDWFELANGYCGAKLDNGFYIDKVSGGLLGKDLDMIVSDIKTSTREIIDEQLYDMIIERDKSDVISNEKFFSMIE